MRESRIELANRLMDIERACSFIGADVMGPYGKHYCPFGDMYHADQNMTRAFRIYPTTNSAYCFACSAYYDPVKLVSLSRGLTYTEASDAILEEVGYQPPDPLTRFHAAASPVAVVETNDLAEALKVFLGRRFQDWETRQFEDAVAEKFNMLLRLLPKIHSDEDASTWLTAAKTVMTRELEEKSQ